jgi:hypothetical protein
LNLYFIFIFNSFIFIFNNLWLSAHAYVTIVSVSEQQLSFSPTRKIFLFHSRLDNWDSPYRHAQVFNVVQVKVFNTNRSVLLGGYRHYLSPNLYALGNIIESICIILLMLYAFDMTVAQMIVRSVFFIRFQGQAEQRQKQVFMAD